MVVAAGRLCAAVDGRFKAAGQGVAMMGGENG
jgi:hypothetical protein